MSNFSDSIKEFINIDGLTTKIKTLETELSLLKALQTSLGKSKRGRPAGQTTQKAPKKAKRRKRGSVGASIRAFLATKGKEGAKVKEIAGAPGNKPANVTAFFYGKGNKKEFKRVAPGTFAVKK